MEAKQRKEKFIALLNELLEDRKILKIKLAQKLEINSSTLTRWFQGKIDPATLDSINFVRLSEIANLSSDELADRLGMSRSSEAEDLNRFKDLIKSLLSSQSMEELGGKLGVTYGAISGWLSSQKSINPSRIAIGTIIALASEKGWTLERLLIYLGLKEAKIENDLLFKLQSGANALSLSDRVKLLAWLSNRIQQEIIEEKTISKTLKTNSEISVRDSTRPGATVLVILEKEDKRDRDTDLSFAQRASNYSSNLVRHLQLEPENIAIATIQKLPKSIATSDILIFDISSSDSPSIAKIQEIEFDGNIIVFAPDDLPSEVMANLSVRVSDLVIKPIDWSSLKDKEYFR